VLEEEVAMPTRNGDPTKKIRLVARVTLCDVMLEEIIQLLVSRDAGQRLL
jgi:hypothetical protein